jgi:hypothetical protein
VGNTEILVVVLYWCVLKVPGILRFKVGPLTDIILSVCPAVPKMLSADPNGYATSSHEVCGYISVMADLKFTGFLIK